jgi:pilus assembly protein CpaC
MNRRKKRVRQTLEIGVLIVAAISLFGQFSFAEQVDKRTLELKMGGAELVHTVHPFKRVSIANPEIADLVVLSPTDLYVYAKRVGYTSVILWQEGGAGKTRLDVVVALDLTNLKEKLHLLFPDQQIKVYGTETGIVLAGTVTGPEVVEQVIRLAQQYLPSEKTSETTDEKQEGSKKRGYQVTGRSGWGVTNLLKVQGNQQIMLEVKVAEVTRTSQKDMQASLGIGDIDDNFVGAVGIGNVTTPLEVPFGPSMATLPGGLIGDLIDGTLDGLAQAPNSLLLNFAESTPNVFLNIEDVTVALKFLENEGLARILAEPRLVTQSGQEARFLAGGEFPIPVAQDLNRITIEFKEFGVALVFTPVVLSNGKISLRVAPSVSEITSMSIIPAGIQGADFVVPNLSSRKLETTVELYDGQSLALAGLLQDNIRENAKKVPGLGDIPILGALFRSSNYIQQKTDLLIAVTPHLVKPVTKDTIGYPGQNMEPPNWYEFYLEGRFEGRRPENPPLAENMQSSANVNSLRVSDGQTGGLEGDFGYQSVHPE